MSLRGDSDEEFDKRSGPTRDKFARERMDYGGGMDRGRGYGGDRRGGYGNGGFRGGGGYRPYGRQDSPMRKRPREWEDGPFDRSSEGDGGAPGGAPTFRPTHMMNFKQFLANQDDNITDDQAVAKYQEYKTEFRRQELHKFFVAHKEEEWDPSRGPSTVRMENLRFRLKYHPVDSQRRKEEQRAAVQKRLDVFMRLKEKGWVDRARVDEVAARQIIKLMDGVVILLENGGDEELDILDSMMDDGFHVPEEKDAASKIEEMRRIKGETSTDAEKEDEEPGSDSETEKKEDPTDEADKPPPKKRAKKEEGACSESDSDSESNRSASRRSNEDGATASSEQGDGAAAKPTETAPPSKPSENGEKSGSERRTTLLHRTSFTGYLRVALAEPLPERRFYRRGWATYRRDVNIKEICWSINNNKIRECDLGAIINKDLTRKTRLGNWITCHKQVAQNDLRLAAKLVQLYDAKYGLWINDEAPEAQQEAQQANGDAGIKSNNPLLDGIMDFLVEEASAEEEELLGGRGSSPSGGADGEEAKIPFDRDENMLKVLDRLVLYLRVVHSVDFYNHGEYPNEDEMPNRCGLMHIRGTPTATNPVGEDVAALNKDTKEVVISAKFVQDFIQIFEKKLEPLLKPKDRLADDEAEKLGKKDEEKEVEAFINANCQELAKDKWLCPLSMKKFKGPEFVRKHIHSKHGAKLEEVKQEVGYFNNYLYDAKRPSMPEARPPPVSSGPPPGGPPGGYQPYGGGGAPSYGGDFGGPPPPHRGGYGRFPSRGGYGGYGRDNDGYRPRGGYGRGYGGGYRDHGGRELRTYRDLDAPADDLF